MQPIIQHCMIYKFSHKVGKLQTLLPKRMADAPSLPSICGHVIVVFSSPYPRPLISIFHLNL